MLKLRPYQSAAVEAVWNHIRDRNDNPCVVIPTGGGKSAVIATLCRDAVNWGGRVMVVTHVAELIVQNFKHIEPLLGGVRVGIYSAGLKSRDTEDQVIVAGIQSVYKRPEEFGQLDLVIIDEAHRIPSDGEGMYRQFLQALPDARLIGMTATAYRTGSGMLCAPDALLNHVCFEVGVRELIRDGYLSPLRSKSCAEKIDTSNVGVRGGEFIESELQEAVRDTDKVVMACSEAGYRTTDCKSVLVFCCGIDHAKTVAGALSDIAETRTVFGDTPPEERAATIKDFRDGRFKFLVNVDVLTTGFDAPGVDAVVVMRPTLSPGLWVQMCGRGSRRAEGKKDCLILDFGGNALRHGPIDHINLQTKGPGKGGKAPFKECPECLEALPAGCGICFVCGHKFEREQARHGAEANASDAMSGEEVFDVKSVEYHKHHKGGDVTTRPTLKVWYDTGTMYGVSEWVCIEHDGYARTKACAWWRDRIDGDTPMSVDDALAIAPGLKVPKRIAIRMEGKYPRVTRHEGMYSPEGSSRCHRITNRIQMNCAVKPARSDVALKMSKPTRMRFGVKLKSVTSESKGSCNPPRVDPNLVAMLWWLGTI
jgi:DNA repair protein RadD